jgi:hypothetical protein
MEKAAGEGSVRGSTGRLMLEPPGAEAWGNRGNDAQCEARTKECTGKIIRYSLEDGDFEADTARACVG